MTEIGSRESGTLSSDEYDITVSPAVQTPQRTVDGLTISESGRVNPGENLTATVTAPSDDHNVGIRKPSEDSPVYGFVFGEEGETEITLDTGEMPGTGDPLEPGTYVVLAVVGGDDLKAAAPFVVQAYETTTHAQAVLESGDGLPVTAALDLLPEAENVTIDAVETIVWKDGDSGTRYEMNEVEESTYEVPLTDPPSVDFNIQTTVLMSSEFSDVDNVLVGISDSNTVTGAVDTLQFQGSSDGAGDPQFATPAVTTDRVILGGLGSSAVALPKGDVPGDATPDWTVDREGALSDSSPVEANGLVYVGSGGGVLYGLDGGTGTAQWTYPDTETDGQSAITSTPRVANGSVYVGANDGTVRALAADTGALEWEIDAGGPIYSRPALGGGLVFVTTADGRLVALDGAGERIEWEYDVGTPFGASSPAIDDGSVYVAGDDVYAFDVAGETPMWRAPEYGGTAGSTPLVTGGRVYVGSADRQLSAFDTSTGDQLWTYETTDPIASTPTEVDGRILVATADGSVAVLAGDTGDLRAIEYLSLQNPLALVEPVRSSPVVDGNTVYIGTASTNSSAGQVVALDINRPG